MGGGRSFRPMDWAHFWAMRFGSKAMQSELITKKGTAMKWAVDQITVLANCCLTRIWSITP